MRGAAMPDPSNALAWSQSPPQFSQPQPFGNAQPAPDYNDALSQAWHQSYSRNNPADYEANYRQPSAYESATAALHRLALNAGPLDIDPTRIDAARAADAARPLGDVASEAGQTALAGANPLTSLALHGAGIVGNALAPTALASDQQASQAGRFNPSEQQDLTSLAAKIQEAQRRKATAIAGVPASRSVTGTGKDRSVSTSRDPELVKQATKAIDDEIAGYQGQTNKIYEGADQRDNAQKPWLQTAGPWEKWAATHAPAISLAGGGLAGLLPGKAGPYIISGAGGGIEGFLGSTWPTFQDAHLPEGSPGQAAAQKKLGSPAFWGTEVLPETASGAALGLLGANWGQKGRNAIGAGVNALKGAFTRGTPASGNALAGASSEAAPSSNALSVKPEPVATNAGRDIHLGANGRSMYQDSAGRWQHVGGGMVKKEHRPLWAQSPNQ